MAEAIDNNILERYGPYLDVVDGSNDVLVDKWVLRIDRCGGNIMTKMFLASSRSRGDLQDLIEVSGSWEAAKVAIKGRRQYKDDAKASMELRYITRGEQEKMVDYVDRFKKLLDIAYPDTLNDNWAKLAMGWLCHGSNIPKKDQTKICRQHGSDLKNFLEQFKKLEVDEDANLDQYYSLYGDKRDRYRDSPFQNNVNIARDVHDGIPWSDQHPTPMLAQKFSREKELREIGRNRRMFDDIDRRDKVKEEQLTKDNERETRTCFYCGNIGHLRQDCRMLGNRNRGNSYRGNSNRGNSNRGNSNRGNYKNTRGNYNSRGNNNNIGNYNNRVNISARGNSYGRGNNDRGNYYNNNGRSNYNNYNGDYNNESNNRYNSYNRNPNMS